MSSSWVWKENGGFFVKNVADNLVSCRFETNGAVCGHTLKLHTGNMAYHLEHEHAFGHTQWAEAKAEKLRQGQLAFTNNLLFMISKTFLLRIRISWTARSTRGVFTLRFVT